MKVKMIMSIVLVMLVLMANSSTIPSKWDRDTLINIIDKQLLHFNETIFILDPNEYLKDTLLSEQHKNSFISFASSKNFSLFIIFIDSIVNIHLSTSNIETFTNSIAYGISKVLQINQQNTIIALFSIKDRQMRIRTGKNIVPHLDNNHCNSIIFSLKSHLKSQEYKEVIYTLFNEIMNRYDTPYNSTIDNYLPLIIVTVIFLIIGSIVFFERRKTINKKEKIKQLLLKIKSNKEIETEECVICLDKLDKNDKKKTIRTLECGHQFHGICIVNWLDKNKNCPYCRDVFDKNNDLDKDDSKNDTNHTRESLDSLVTSLYNHHYDISLNHDKSSYDCGDSYSGDSGGASGSW